MNFSQSRRFAGSLMFLILILSTIQIYHYAPLLPAKIATHFNGKGQANGWMSHRAFIWYSIGMYYFIGGLFFLTDWVVPKLPSEMINIPNRTYWMHPARREKALDVLLTYTNWIGVITLLLLLILTQMVIETNLDHSGKLNSYFWYVSILYMIGLGYLGWKLYRYFKPVSLS